MDGIHPTLAFVALFLGLSGNSHDATQQQTDRLENRGDCPLMMIVGVPGQSSDQESLTNAFELGISDTTGAPYLRDSSWARIAHEPGDDASAFDELVVLSGTDPIAQHTVPVLNTISAADPAADLCGQ